MKFIIYYFCGEESQFKTIRTNSVKDVFDIVSETKDNSEYTNLHSFIASHQLCNVYKQNSKDSTEMFLLNYRKILKEFRKLHDKDIKKYLNKDTLRQ